MTKRESNKLDKQIEQFYYKNCSGIQILITDICKVFAAGRVAAAANLSIEQAIIDAVAALRVN